MSVASAYFLYTCIAASLGLAPPALKPQTVHRLQPTPVQVMLVLNSSTPSVRLRQQHSFGGLPRYHDKSLRPVHYDCIEFGKTVLLN